MLPVWRCVQASKKEETFSEQLRVLTAKCKEVRRVFLFYLPAASFSDPAGLSRWIRIFSIPGSNIYKDEGNKINCLFETINFTKF